MFNSKTSPNTTSGPEFGSSEKRELELRIHRIYNAVQSLKPHETNATIKLSAAAETMSANATPSRTEHAVVDSTRQFQDTYRLSQAVQPNIEKLTATAALPTKPAEKLNSNLTTEDARMSIEQAFLPERSNEDVK